MGLVARVISKVAVLIITHMPKKFTLVGFCRLGSEGLGLRVGVF